jgi:hypothetical protein
MPPPAEPAPIWAIAAERRVRRALLIATAIGGLCLGALTFTKPAGLFSGDEGVKLVQSLAVLAHGPLDPALDYPGARADPTYRYFPLGPPFVLEHAGARYGIYPLAFTGPSAIGYALAGFWGLFLVPLLGGIWALHATMRLTTVVTGRVGWGVLAGALLVIATPVSAAAILGACALYNLAVTGHVLPALAGNLGSGDAYDRRRLLFDPWLAEASPIPPELLLIGLVLLGALAPRLARARHGATITALLGGLAITAFAGLALAALDGLTPGLGERRHTVGLFATTPLLLLGLVEVDAGAAPRARLRSALWGLALAAILAIALANVANDGGLQLGARYLLIAVPLLLALAIARLAEGGWRWWLIGLGPALISVLALRADLAALRVISGKSAALTEAARATGTTDLVTDIEWAPQILAPLWPTHRLYLAPDRALLRALRASGASQVGQILGGLEPLRLELGDATVIDAGMNAIRYELTPPPRRVPHLRN